MSIEFQKFPKIARFNSPCTITEKIDGTNAQIIITEDGDFITGSRNRVITPDDDNYGFSRWAHDHKDELIGGLGVGRHYGEWWGQGIQRKYDMDRKVFSLFNTHRWTPGNPPPECCDVVPVIYDGEFSFGIFELCEVDLRDGGSRASYGFKNPEGFMVYFQNNGMYLKHPFGK